MMNLYERNKMRNTNTIRFSGCLVWISFIGSAVWIAINILAITVYANNDAQCDDKTFKIWLLLSFIFAIVSPVALYVYFKYVDKPREKLVVCIYLLFYFIWSIVGYVLYNKAIDSQSDSCDKRMLKTQGIHVVSWYIVLSVCSFLLYFFEQIGFCETNGNSTNSCTGCDCNNCICL